LLFLLQYGLALTLFMFWICTNNHNSSMATD
jgi:hypothetical protein